MARKVSGKTWTDGGGEGVTTEAPALAPAANGATGAPSTRSRLCAPTASSLAKMSENARNKLNTSSSATAASTNARSRMGAAAGAAKMRASAGVGHGQVPTISPLVPRKKNHSLAVPAGANGGAPVRRATSVEHGTSGEKPPSGSASGGGSGGAGTIFSRPLILPSSPQARAAEERGEVVNPITGAVAAASCVAAADDMGLPSLMAMTESLLTEVREQDESGEGYGYEDGEGEGEEEGLMRNEDEDMQGPSEGEHGVGAPEREQGDGEGKTAGRVPSMVRRPRISRSKIIAKLGAQRERVGGTKGDVGAGADASAGTGGVRQPLRPGVGARANVHNNNAGSSNNSNSNNKMNNVKTGPGAKKSLPAPAKTNGVHGAKTRVSALSAVTSPKGNGGDGRRRSAAVIGSNSGSGGGRNSHAGAGAAVLLSAKKRVRESEYARRRSARVGSGIAKPVGAGAGAGVGALLQEAGVGEGDEMDVDE